MKHNKTKLGSLRSFIDKSALSSWILDSQTKKTTVRKHEMKNGARKCSSFQPSVVPPVEAQTYNDDQLCARRPCGYSAAHDLLVKARINSNKAAVIKNTPNKSNLCNLENLLKAVCRCIFHGISNAPTPAEANARIAMKRNNHLHEASSNTPPLLEIASLESELVGYVAGLRCLQNNSEGVCDGCDEAE